MIPPQFGRDGNEQQHREASKAELFPERRLECGVSNLRLPRRSVRETKIRTLETCLDDLRDRRILELL